MSYILIFLKPWYDNIKRPYQEAYCKYFQVSLDIQEDEKLVIVLNVQMNRVTYIYWIQY